MLRNSVLVLVLLALVGFVIIKNNTVNPNNNVLGIETQGQITPTAASTETSYPTSTGLIQGIVLSLGSTPVTYKNSYVAVVQDTKNNTFNVYFTPTTAFYTANNLSAKREDVKQGDSIFIQGNPAEGGIEAVQVIILPKAVNSPSLSPTISQ